ncbi:hypothetical protein BDV96DRAFT_562155 [Lophiotrema nucula]|uniref:Uncharacterized protein n=1 Tax=Lophiotrema nucula TaxID=690887 RepID=A0A6A5ZU69_9PLEO|nr:hypothetical protein BDV96DRAFT_562155 [Lophiotrema nucula]
MLLVDLQLCLETHPLQVPSILRIFTFDELRLTHTCHNNRHHDFNVNPVEQLARKDIENIQYAEAEDLALLEQLITEFEEAWSSFEGTILGFIVGYWAERMDEVLASRVVSEAEAQKRMEEAGAVIVGPEKPPLVKKPWYGLIYGSQEWFEKGVEMILDGSYTQNPSFYNYWDYEAS